MPTKQTTTPKNWQQVKLGDVCDIVNGSTPKRSVPEYWKNGNIPWFTIEDIRSGGRIINETKQSITDKALKETSVKMLPKDSILLCCTASIGEVAFTKIPLTTNQQFNGLVIKDKKNVFPNYLFYSIQKFGKNLKKKTGKTTIGFLSVGNLSKEEILLPPLSEQQKIAEILEAVDLEIEKVSEEIEKSEKMKRGLMDDLLVRDILNNNYPQFKIGKICETDSGGTPSRKKKEYFEDGTISWLTSGEIKKGKIYSSKQSITELGLSSSSAKVFPTDTVLVAMYGVTAGQVGILKSEMSTNQAICGILPNKKIFPEFLYQYLLVKSSYLRSLAGGGAQPNISQKIIKDQHIPVPPIEKQKQIAEILSTVDDKVKITKNLKNSLTKLKKGLMQDLLSGVVRVNVLNV